MKGPYFEYCKWLASRYKIRGKVFFTGKLPHSEVSEYINSCTCVVVPSLWQEPFGRVSIEAMATGTPAIVTDRGGLTEGTKTQLVAEASPKSLSEKINYLLSDFGRYKEFSINGRKEAKKFGLKNMGRLFLGILHEELGNGKKNKLNG